MVGFEYFLKDRRLFEENNVELIKNSFNISIVCVTVLLFSSISSFHEQSLTTIVVNGA